MAEWQVNGTPDTLSSSGSVMAITDLTAKKFNQFLIHTFATGGVIDFRGTFNNNTNSVYATRRSDNGASDSTLVSRAFLDLWFNSQNSDFFHILYVVSISGEEKLLIGNFIERGLAGAGNAPNRNVFVSKFVPSPDADITRMDINETLAGSYDTDSNLSALGTD